MTDTGAIWVFSGEARRGVANDGVPTLLTDTTLTSVTNAPPTGFTHMIDDIIISSDAAVYCSFKEETSGTLLLPRIQFSGAGTIQITPRNGIKLQTAVKKLQAQLSGTANVSILVNYHPVAGKAT